jgi:hypothetical protein
MIVGIIKIGAGLVALEEFRDAVDEATAVSDFCSGYSPALDVEDYLGVNASSIDLQKKWGWNFSEAAPALEQVINVSNTIYPLDYEDVATIKDIHLFGYLSNMDYLLRMVNISSIVTGLGGGDVDAGFDTLDAETKDICSQYSIGSKPKRLFFLGEEKMLQYSKTIHQQSRECREMRMEVVYSKLYLELEHTDKDEIITDIINNNCLTAYIEFSRYGSVLGQHDGAYDWLKGLNSFAGNGFIDKDYIPLTMTLTELSDYCCDVLFNGNYTTD